MHPSHEPRLDVACEACGASAAGGDLYLPCPGPKPPADPKLPRRWKRKNSFTGLYYFGCYFPSSGVNASDGGSFVPGEPHDVEWLDGPAEVTP